MVEKVCIGLRYFGCILCNLKEVVCNRCGRSSLHVFCDIVNHFSNVVDHQEYYLTRRVVIHVHPAVSMYFASHDGRFFNLPIFRINVSKNSGNNVRVNR